MAGEMSKHIGNRIRERREEMGLKQRELADLVDKTGAIDNQRISDWERGVNRPSDRYMAKLSEALDSPAGHFISRLQYTTDLGNGQTLEWLAPVGD